MASFQGISFTPDRGVTLRWTVPQRDGAGRPIAAGSYGLRVFVRDPRTFVAGDPSTFLIRDDINDVFQVAVPLAEAPAGPTIFAPPPPELEARPGCRPRSKLQQPGGLL